MKGVFIIFLTISGICLAQNDSVVDKTSIFSKIEKSESIDYILHNSNIPLGTFTFYNTYIEIVCNYATEVHEHYHVLNNFLTAINGNGRSYFLKEDETVKVDKVDSIPSSRIIIDSIPFSLKQNSNRYWVYIEDTLSNKNDSQVNGIYGLLEEFAAYSFSVSSSIEAYNFLNLKQAEDKLKLKLLNDNSDYLNAYYEFNYFIYQYLSNLKSMDFIKFNELVSNEKIKNIYFKTNERFKKEFEVFNDCLEQFIESHKDKLVVENGYYYLIDDMQHGYSFSKSKLEKIKNIYESNKIDDELYKIFHK